VKELLRLLGQHKNPTSLFMSDTRSTIPLALMPEMSATREWSPKVAEAEEEAEVVDQLEVQETRRWVSGN
jgi:hypothetical protein